MRLWAGVMSDGIRVLRTSRSPLRRAEVAAWVNRPDAPDEEFGSFNWVCVELGIDTAYARRDILALGTAR